MAIVKFRNFINQMAISTGDYLPVYTELKGIGNIASGCLQILIGYLMRYHSAPKYHNIQSKRHLERGTEALKLGIRESLPTITIAVCSYWLVQRKWSYFS